MFGEITARPSVAFDIKGQKDSFYKSEHSYGVPKVPLIK
jgi:hypothetical protein